MNRSSSVAREELAVASPSPFAAEAASEVAAAAAGGDIRRQRRQLRRHRHGGGIIDLIHAVIVTVTIVILKELTAAVYTADIQQIGAAAALIGAEEQELIGASVVTVTGLIMLLHVLRGSGKQTSRKMREVVIVHRILRLIGRDNRGISKQIQKEFNSTQQLHSPTVGSSVFAAGKPVSAPGFFRHDCRPSSSFPPVTALTMLLRIVAAKQPRPPATAATESAASTRSDPALPSRNWLLPFEDAGPGHRGDGNGQTNADPLELGGAVGVSVENLCDSLPEIIGVRNLVATFDGGAFPGKFIKSHKLTLIPRNIPLPKRGDEDLSDARERAAAGQPVTIQRRAHEENNVGQPHGGGQGAERGAPAVLDLNVDDGGEGDNGADGDREVEEVEEPVEMLFVVSVPLVELVGPEGGNAGPYPCGSEACHVKGCVEICHLPWLCGLATAQEKGKLIAVVLVWD
nr:hypothetical protein Iba_chr13aCG1920 [Ipomoea batatas]